MRLPRLTVRSRTGVPIDPYDIRQYTLNSATSGRMGFKNSVGSAAANVSRSFATTLPLTLKAGILVENTERDNWTESMTWNFRPPASAGGQIVGNYDLIADAYAARRTFNDGINIKFVSTTKLYELYRQHPNIFS